MVYNLYQWLRSRCKNMVRKSIFPRSSSDWTAFVFTIVGVIGVLVIELFVVVPRVYDTSEQIIQVSFHFICGLFIAANVLGNFAKIIIMDTSSGSAILPAVLKKNWRFCPVCEANAPPRSQHCTTCGICVLRRDHHCTFTGCCIGFHNYRYYFMFLLHLSVGTFYAALLNFNVLFDVLGGLSIGNIVMHVFPVAGWMFDFIDLYQLAWISLSAVCVYSFMFCILLTLYQASLFLNGQTAHEKNKNVQTYKYGSWKEQLKEFLGARWFIAWIFPTLSSLLQGDGTEFMTKEKFKIESHKNR